MAKPSAFVKISGNLLGNEQVASWLKELASDYHVCICVGGGEQISQAFAKRGIETRFGPLGRITANFDERQLARDVLEKNQAEIQDQLDSLQIAARVIIPVAEIGSVLCHINGDIMLLAAYNGYDRLYLLTTTERVAKKQVWVSQVASVFSAIEKGELDKIEVIGF